MRKTFLFLFAFALLGLALLCPDGEVWCSGLGGAAMVNIQVTFGGDFQNVKAMVDELLRRGIKATLWVTEVGDPPETRAYLAELSSKGYEIGVRVDADLTRLGYEEQLKVASEMVAAVTACTGKPVRGLRATRFTWNEHTIRVAEELKLAYIMADVERTPERFGDAPYYPEGRGFGVLGVTQAVYPDGSTGILCDAPASKKVTADTYAQLLAQVIDRRVAEGKPMVFEWHPGGISRPGADNPWWNAFISFLDYLQSKGRQVWFLTGHEIVVFCDPCQC